MNKQNAQILNQIKYTAYFKIYIYIKYVHVCVCLHCAKSAIVCKILKFTFEVNNKLIKWILLSLKFIG